MMMTHPCHEAEEKSMQTFRCTRFYIDYHDRDSNRDNWCFGRISDYNRDHHRPDSEGKIDLQKQLFDFIKSQQSIVLFIKETFMDLKTKLECTTKNDQASIQNLEEKFDRLADKQSARPSGSLPSNAQPNLRGSSSKPYQPPQALNEQVSTVFTRSGKPYDPPPNPNNLQPPIEFKSDDKEPTPQTPKPIKEIKETLVPKPYKPIIPYPNFLGKRKWKHNIENSSL
ncbi:hypothetical protein Tco_0957691 [Tanacetum coccineum]